MPHQQGTHQSLPAFGVLALLVLRLGACPFASLSAAPGPLPLGLDWHFGSLASLRRGLQRCGEQFHCKCPFVSIGHSAERPSRCKVQTAGLFHALSGLPTGCGLSCRVPVCSIRSHATTSPWSGQEKGPRIEPAHSIPDCNAAKPADPLDAVGSV